MIEKLDLRFESFEDEASNRKAISELRRMMESAGWKFIEKVLQSNAERYANILLGQETIDGETGQEKLSEAEREILVNRRLDLLATMNIPRKQLAVLQGKPEEEPEDDPYGTVKDERDGRVKS